VKTKKNCNKASAKLTARINQARSDLQTELRRHNKRLPASLKNAYLNVQKRFLDPLYKPVAQSCPTAVSNQMKKKMAQFQTEVTKVPTAGVKTKKK
ncbi:hypothetical protein, partial [Magnetococcus sp. PR-3]|uniref:hypothetical protein n=1 Tax=Magnetococcus sp. PR-3 TaxID=3120355 RepID=UPI002FCE5E76